VSIATCNGLDIVSARFTFRLQGAWDAEFAVIGESTAAVSGALSIVVDGQTLRATATRSEADSGGLVTVQAIGGAGGLGTAVPSLGYVSTTRRLVIVDALSLGGESLDATSSARLDEYLPHWTRSAGTVGDAVRAQAKSLAAMLLDLTELPRARFRIDNIRGKVTRELSQLITVGDTKVLSASKTAHITGLAWRFDEVTGWTQSIEAIDATSWFPYQSSPGYFVLDVDKTYGPGGTKVVFY
jgi:hypothetical protein